MATVGFPLSDGIELQLSDRGVTGFYGVSRWTEGQGQQNYDFETTINRADPDFEGLDDRIYDLPRGAWFGNNTFVIGGDDDPRKAAYKRAYFLADGSKVLDAYFAKYPNGGTHRDWKQFQYKYPYPRDLLTELPDNAQEIKDIAKQISRGERHGYVRKNQRGAAAPRVNPAAQQFAEFISGLGIRGGQLASVLPQPTKQGDPTPVEIVSKLQRMNGDEIISTLKTYGIDLTDPQTIERIKSAGTVSEAVFEATMMFDRILMLAGLKK